MSQKSIKTIHFVGTVPMSGNIFRRIVDKLISIVGLPPLYRSGNDAWINWPQPTRSPHSISIHLLRELKKHGKVKFYNIHEKGVIKLGSDDIFVGQPLPKGAFDMSGRTEGDDRNSITSRTLRENPQNKHKFLITPYASDPLLVSWMHDLAKNYADKIVLYACGEIWTRNWEHGPFGDISLDKILRVDNAIDVADYPMVKKKFNLPEKRKFLYIGHTAWYKNTAELERIAEHMPGFVGGHIGGGKVKGWQKIADFAKLSPGFMAQIAEEYDIFVTTSSGDSQATTILEAVSFGFPVACTPQTGYEWPSIVSLSTSDTASNITKLTALKNTPESDLQKMVKENYTIATTEYTWEKFLNKIINFLDLD